MPTDTQEQKLEFGRLTAEEAGVYSVICPDKKTINANKILEYPMPDRCLEIVKMTLQDNLFIRYDIWESEMAEVYDPILIGRKVEPSRPYSWADTLFLIARWGKELLPFNELKTIAHSKLKDTLILSAIKVKAQINTFLSNPDIFVKEKISKDRIGDFGLFSIF